ncbi:hypothetical protein AURDEDRAFT_169241 [Auricularia subglabra TFB-10046 SS5]|nr:hypothetical protein AURDEDRAFT_169241 [Auricularia subglabra TFB-10046 SS5]
MSSPSSPAPFTMTSPTAHRNRSPLAEAPQSARTAAPGSRATTAPAPMPGLATTTTASNAASSYKDGLPDDWRTRNAVDRQGRAPSAAPPKSTFEAFKKHEKDNSGPQAQSHALPQRGPGGSASKQPAAAKPEYLVALGARRKAREAQQLAASTVLESFATTVPLGAEDDIFDRRVDAKPHVALPTRRSSALEQHDPNTRAQKLQAEKALKKKVAMLIQSGCDTNTIAEEIITTFPYVV